MKFYIVLHNIGIYDAINYKIGDTKKLMKSVSNASVFLPYPDTLH